MTLPKPFSYLPGRRLLGRLPADRDLLEAVEALCRAEGVETAVFHVSGTVVDPTVGSYDPTQQVWVTACKDGAHEIVTCTGTVGAQEKDPKALARILAADTRGNLHGGRLFSPTRIFAAEIDIQVLDGPAARRTYDAETGLWRLLQPPAAG